MNGTAYDILLGAPKARAEMTIIEKPDMISDKVRKLKLELLSYATLDKKIAALIKHVTVELQPQERCLFLTLLEQSIYRDLLLSGFGIFAGFILIKGGLDKSVQDASKLFRLMCVSTGLASLTFGGKTISDNLTFLNVIRDLSQKYKCKR